MKEVDKKAGYDEIKKEEKHLKDLLKTKLTLTRELIELETRIFRLETNYLEETKNSGNIVRGFDKYLLETSGGTSNNTPTLGGFMKRPRNHSLAIDPNDRIFSNASATLNQTGDRREERKIKPIKIPLDKLNKDISDSFDKPKNGNSINNSNNKPRIKLKVNSPSRSEAGNEDLRDL